MDCIRNDYRLNGAGYANHRQVYEQHHGPIPKGMVVMHTCGNRWCVNPEHLVLGTQHENRMEQVTRGANPKQKISFEEAELIRWCGLQGPKKYGWGQAVANVFGVDKGAISKILNRKTFLEAG
nr:hypothetical protein [uncultured Mediterranean phage uvMED]